MNTGESTVDQLTRLSEIARTKTFTGQSTDRLVRAVVDGGGQLRALSIGPLDRSRTSTAVLAKDVLEAVSAANDVAAAEVNARIAKILGITPEDFDRKSRELLSLATRAIREAGVEPDPDTTHQLAGGVGHVTCDSGRLASVELAEDVLHRMNEKTLAERLTAAITQAQRKG
jgi:DNA-binding protein YbaB